MARAKRTDRAEARRRHRAAQAELTDTPEEAAPDDASGDTAPRRTPASSQPAQTGIRYAFGAAFRPLDLRGDLAYLPRLLRHRAFLVPAAIQVAAVVVLLATGLNFASILLFQYFVVAPPIGANFLAGFLAERAGWLAGWLTGLVGVIGMAVIVYSPRFADVNGTEVSREAILLQSALISPPAGALFAAAAAWYRRFLNLANPNRGRRPASSQKGKSRSNPRPLVSRTSPRRR